MREAILVVIANDFHARKLKNGPLSRKSQPARHAQGDACLPLRRAVHYIADMPSDPELKRLAWRAHHRGTREADLLIGGFFDAHHASWRADECALFDEMLEEQDVDIMAWAHGCAEAPERFCGPMIEALMRLDYVRIAK